MEAARFQDALKEEDAENGTENARQHVEDIVMTGVYRREPYAHCYQYKYEIEVAELFLPPIIDNDQGIGGMQ